jgi:predicted nucleic acid-binding protein
MAKLKENKTMPKVFVDTAAWLALLNTSDSLHPQARQVMGTLQQQNTQLITTEFVLLEVADALSTPSIRSQAIAFINKLRQSPLLQIIPCSSTLLASGWELYSQRLDKEWGLTDCTSFVVMTEQQISQAFTSDHHFKQAGFISLLTSN